MFCNLNCQTLEARSKKPTHLNPIHTLTPHLASFSSLLGPQAAAFQSQKALKAPRRKCQNPKPQPETPLNSQHQQTPGPRPLISEPQTLPRTPRIRLQGSLDPSSTDAIADPTLVESSCATAGPWEVGALQGLRVLEFWSCGVFRVLGFWVLGWEASRHFGGFTVSGVWDQTRGHGRKPTARGFWLESFGHQGVRFFAFFFCQMGLVARESV